MKGAGMGFDSFFYGLGKGHSRSGTLHLVRLGRSRTVRSGKVSKAILQIAQRQVLCHTVDSVVSF
jgi:hypothetical protein